jgi:hypothetical protein
VDGIIADRMNARHRPTRSGPPFPDGPPGCHFFVLLGERHYVHIALGVGEDPVDHRSLVDAVGVGSAGALQILHEGVHSHDDVGAVVEDRAPGVTETRAGFTPAGVGGELDIEARVEVACQIYQLCRSHEPRPVGQLQGLDT